MKKSRWILWTVALVLLAAIAWALRRVHFDWATCWQQLRHAEWKHVVLGIALIWFAYLIRAARWAVFLRPQKHVAATSLIGTQVVGFTAVALFGRLADLVRPYLVAKRVNLSISSQIAVYSVERMFDMICIGIIFSATLVLAPDTRSLPHHEAFIRAGWLGLAVALAGGLFAVFTRMRGEQLGLRRRALAPRSLSQICVPPPAIESSASAKDSTFLALLRRFRSRARPLAHHVGHDFQHLHRRGARLR